MRVLQQVVQMSKRMNTAIKRKQTQSYSFGFEKIKIKAIESVQRKKRTKDSGSQTKILQETNTASRISNGVSRISMKSHNVGSQVQQLSYVRPSNKVIIHRGSRSRSRSVSPNSSYIRVNRQEQVATTPKQQYRSHVHIHEMTPKIVSTKLSQRSPAKNYYEVDQIKREYRNCYRIAPTRIRVVSCGCEHLLEKSCKCTALVNRLCGCNTCHHSCDGCDKCNTCHSHCSCAHSISNRSCSKSKEKKIIKIIKSPSKKNIDQRPPQNRNHYLNHLQTTSPRGGTFRFEFQQTTVTKIRR